MSVTTTPASLKERLSHRRQALQRVHTFVIPVTGYEGMIAARYRGLYYEELREIGRANQNLDGTASGEIAIATDTLIAACQELLEDTGEKDDRNQPIYKSLGRRWDEDTVRELFGAEDIPIGTQPREALQWVLPTTQLMMHFAEYDTQMRSVTDDIDREISGESPANSEEISPGWQPQPPSVGSP
jgi:hypothetical protein